MFHNFPGTYSFSHYSLPEEPTKNTKRIRLSTRSELLPSKFRNKPALKMIYTEN